MTKLLEMTVTVEIEDGFQQDQQFQALDEFDQREIPDKIESAIMASLRRAKSIALQQAIVHVEE